MEAEAEFRRDVRVRPLFHVQRDIEPHALGLGVVGAAVGGLHYAGAAAGHHHQALPGDAVFKGNQFAELAGDFVVLGGISQALGRGQVALELRVAAVFLKLRLKLGHARGGLLEAAGAGAAEHDHGGLHVVLGQDHLRLEKFELQAHRAQLGAAHELGVGIRPAVRLRPAQRHHFLAYLGLFFHFVLLFVRHFFSSHAAAEPAIFSEVRPSSS